MRQVVVAVAAVAAALAGGSFVFAESGSNPGPTAPGLDPGTALNRSGQAPDPGSRPRPRFEVTLADSASRRPLDGRVYVIVSRAAEGEPRDQIDVPDGVPFWGRDVDGLRPGRDVELSGGDARVFGYPLRSLDDLPSGDYSVQAFMNVYTTFRRSDGSVVKLHMPCGDGHDVFGGTGNLYSGVQRVHLSPRSRRPIRLQLTEVIPPREPVPEGGTCQQGNPPDTPHVKHIKIKSELLSRYWGQPMYIGANVLLPEGYEQHPDARYPVVYQHGHYPGGGVFGFREDLGNAFSRFWTGPDAPRVIAVSFRHENPFYDDSYAVNSANLGPYGDAITSELMAEIDRSFRTMGEPWARVLTGGSTGGWEALAQQVYYPDLYAGAFASCPDPVDFRYHQIVNVYSDANAYWRESEWNRVPRPSARQVDGAINYTMEDENHFELAIGDRGRSGGQWDIWEAVYGPQGADGYPARVWDKRTGRIEHGVAERWRDKDIRDYLERNWSEVGPKLVEKIHITTGDDDTYYLENAVQLLDRFLAGTSEPAAKAEIQYGNDQPHCWSPYTTPQLIQKMVDFMVGHAPEGADTTSWRY
jgi:hypothetical protein